LNHAAQEDASIDLAALSRAAANVEGLSRQVTESGTRAADVEAETGQVVSLRLFSGLSPLILARIQQKIARSARQIMPRSHQLEYEEKAAHGIHGPPGDATPPWIREPPFPFAKETVHG